MHFGVEEAAVLLTNLNCVFFDVLQIYHGVFGTIVFSGLIAPNIVNILGDNSIQNSILVNQCLNKYKAALGDNLL